MVGAVGNNCVDTVGPAWDVGLIPYRVTQPNAATFDNNLVNFIHTARLVDGKGVDIANISSVSFQGTIEGTQPTACQNVDNLQGWGAPVPKSKFFNGKNGVVDQLLAQWPTMDAGNILFTVAAGNCRWNLDALDDVFVFPASLRRQLQLKNMLVVTSLTKNGFIWSDPAEALATPPPPRPIGPQSIDLAAPTDEGCVLSNVPVTVAGITSNHTCTCGTDPDSVCFGTSFAAPMVAGVAVLVLQRHPEFKGHPDLIAGAILSSVKPSPAMESPGFPTVETAVSSHGMLNAFGAVQ